MVAMVMDGAGAERYLRGTGLATEALRARPPPCHTATTNFERAGANTTRLHRNEMAVAPEAVTPQQSTRTHARLSGRSRSVIVAG